MIHPTRRLTRTSLHRLAAVSALTVLLGSSAACSSDDGAAVRKTGESGSAGGAPSGTGDTTGSGTAAEGACVPIGDPADAVATVKVELSEWSVSVDEKPIKAGLVALEAVNKSDIPHELVLIREVAPADLPKSADGSLDEASLPAGARIDEIAPFPGGESCTGVFELSVGSYTLLCNNVTDGADGEKVAHLDKGMVTEITIE